MNASDFRDYFIPLSGCFSPFPRGTIHYRSPELFSLGRWSSQVRAGFHVSDLTQDTPTKCTVSATGLSPSMAARSRVVCLQYIYRLRSPTTPVHKINGFGLFPVRSPLLRESLLIYLPLLLRCFSSQSDRRGSLLTSMDLVVFLLVLKKGLGVSSLGLVEMIFP